MKAWSYSSLNAFETCPRQYYLMRVKKVAPDRPTEATTWGNEVHKALEDAVSLNTPLPESMQKWGKYVDKLRGATGQVFTERKIALTKNLTPTGWFDSDAWCRGILDVSVLKDKKAVIWDWKTGKVRPDSAQLKLFAGFAFAQHPEIERVQTAFIWLVHDKITTGDFTRDDLPSIWQEFMAKSQRLENAFATDKWLPNPSGLCRAYCFVGKQYCDFCGGA